MSTLLKPQNIKLNASPSSQEEAIEQAGRILVEQGYVTESYVPAMKQREELTSTFMGNFVAIPHGTEEAKTEVLASGLSFLQIPEGVEFNGETVKLVIGIAGKDGEHLELLSQIAIVCSEIENVEKLVAASSEEEIISIFEEAE
ncbi:PTS sugar transporter subunit IIA [Jeotgalibacillus proteolyticus]|uniref:Mannitol-specific phosphotransferase enzyme IIA component n=1 Tax=Jeotgalibacillus proteolyticus TaxID=2082395 RepID=A0A2S5GCE5_9BACL|nr:PTS sugar transporter subunit IIA [Jeotgalibacillus proteolyticus]PPA70584.1 PTS mannitol transporter subunit IIA [Jeotgalibacillus proteolyticus]